MQRRKRDRERERERETKTENWFLPFPFQIQLLSENAAERGNPRKGKKERERMIERERRTVVGGVGCSGQAESSPRKKGNILQKGVKEAHRRIV